MCLTQFTNSPEFISLSCLTQFIIYLPHVSNPLHTLPVRVNPSYVFDTIHPLTGQGLSPWSVWHRSPTHLSGSISLMCLTQFSLPCREVSARAMISTPSSDHVHRRVRMGEDAYRRWERSMYTRALRTSRDEYSSSTLLAVTPSQWHMWAFQWGFV